jgi:uncharacterized protein YndB with AHSA1/START domain
MSTVQTSIEPIQRSVTVNRSVEDAFRVFTEGISTWWPLHTHSIEAMDSNRGSVPTAAVLEPREGGRLYERMSTGEEGYWGTITTWEPPHRVVISWKVNPEALAPTEIDVRFTEEDGATRVDLEHRGWERLGEKAAEARASYSDGWKEVFGRYAAVANSA